MKNILLIGFIFCFYLTRGQSTNCDCNAFINWKIIDIANLKGQEELRLLFKTEMNCDNDEYRILKDSSDCFLIKRNDYIKNERDTFSISKKHIWVRKQNLFGNYTQRTFEILFILYSNPDKNSDKLVNRVLTKEEFGSLMTIENCKVGWLKVKVILGGRIYEGWIEKSTGCPLKCTTCS